MNNHSLSLRNYSIQPGDNYWLLARRFNISVNDIFAANPGVDPYRLLIGQNIHIPMKTSAFQSTRSSKCISPAEVELKGKMRSLWEEHVAWTRMTIISLTFKLPDIDAVVTRLLQNATDMGDALRPLYGNQIGDTFGNLMKEHLLFAADLVKAAIAGDQQAAMTAEKKWYANADEISIFLNKINPFLPVQDVRRMLYTHLDLTKSEAILMINMEYQKDIKVYDEIQEQALLMSDAITEGIVKQFPNIFGYTIS
jgi:LysM repeat protein